MKRFCVELRIVDFENANTVNLGNYDEFSDDLKDRVETLLFADCDVLLRPCFWSDGEGK